MRGRKPGYESRATEFRQRLIAWKQAPESLRLSLRALARELGTSHQMLAYYLYGLGSWQAEERAKQIRARAKAEGREMTMRECCDAIITPGFFRKIEELRREANRGPLNHWQIETLKMLTRQGFSGAKEILGTCRQMTPGEERQARASERAAGFAAAAAKTIKRIEQDGARGPLCWQDIERLKYLARRKYPEAKELLEKYSQTAEPKPKLELYSQAAVPCKDTAKAAARAAATLKR
jgi:transcriptional regulator with XRE-family HTH domain